MSVIIKGLTGPTPESFVDIPMPEPLRQPADPIPFPEMWLVMWFSAKTGGAIGYEMFHPNRAAAEAKAEQLRRELSPKLDTPHSFRVVSYVVGEVLP